MTTEFTWKITYARNGDNMLPYTGKRPLLCDADAIRGAALHRASLVVREHTGTPAPAKRRALEEKGPTEPWLDFEARCALVAHTRKRTGRVDDIVREAKNDVAEIAANLAEAEGNVVRTYIRLMITLIDDFISARDDLSKRAARETLIGFVSKHGCVNVSTTAHAPTILWEVVLRDDPELIDIFVGLGANLGHRAHIEGFTVLPIEQAAMCDASRALDRMFEIGAPLRYTADGRLWLHPEVPVPQELHRRERERLCDTLLKAEALRALPVEIVDIIARYVLGDAVPEVYTPQTADPIADDVPRERPRTDTESPPYNPMSPSYAPTSPSYAPASPTPMDLFTTDALDKAYAARVTRDTMRQLPLYFG